MSELQPGTAACLVLGKVQEALTAPRVPGPHPRGEALEQIQVFFPNTTSVFQRGQSWSQLPVPWAGLGLMLLGTWGREHPLDASSCEAELNLGTTAVQTALL